MALQITRLIVSYYIAAPSIMLQHTDVGAGSSKNDVYTTDHLPYIKFPVPLEHLIGVEVSRYVLSPQKQDLDKQGKHKKKQVSYSVDKASQELHVMI